MSDQLQDRLKSARKAAGLTQARLAEIVGMSQPSYQQLESGKSHGSVFLPQIAHVLNVDALWLQTGAGSSELPTRSYADARPKELQILIENLDLMAAENKLPPELVTMLQNAVETVVKIQSAAKKQPPANHDFSRKMVF